MSEAATGRDLDDRDDLGRLGVLAASVVAVIPWEQLRGLHVFCTDRPIEIRADQAQLAGIAILAE